MNDQIKKLDKKHPVFVIGKDGKPLTPTTNTKARKLLKGKQAKPIWNKFGVFGLKMLVETRKEIPEHLINKLSINYKKK